VTGPAAGAAALVGSADATVRTAFALGYAFHGDDLGGGRPLVTEQRCCSSMVMTGDSPALYGDCFIGMTPCARTRSCRVSLHP
jgi:hypothetical protein